jgi:hypothetical protein
MDNKTGASCWIAVAIISAIYIYVGGITIETDIIVALLVITAFALTFIVTFGLEGMRQYSPAAKAKVQTSLELTEIKATINELAKKVDAIQKELAE